MEYILDTHVLLWTMFGSEKLSDKVKSILLDKQINKSVSIASVWEIAIKHRIGKLFLPTGVRGVFVGINVLGYGILEVDKLHVERYAALPLLHRDPFDGIIIAAAQAENMTLITADENMQKYDILWVW